MENIRKIIFVITFSPCIASKFQTIFFSLFEKTSLLKTIDDKLIFVFVIWKSYIIEKVLIEVRIFHFVT